MKKFGKPLFFRCVLPLMLCLAAALAAVPGARAMLSARAAEAEESKVVRVGWYESPFNQRDEFGRRSGYAYEYQQKIAAYTGWTYEYVEGTWPELYQMLLAGELDLMSDVSYTEERAELMLYASLPMGDESYYLCVSSQYDSGISAQDLTTFNGKRVGVNKGTVQEQLFLEWEEKNDIHAEIVELMVNEEESIELLDKGEIDAFITVDAYGEIQKIVPLIKVGSSNFYFVVNKDRHDLARELDSALNRIQDENRTYNQKLQEKYINSTIVSVYFPQAEVRWLHDHTPIRVGYQDNFLAFCAQDKETGELSGALADFLDMAGGTVKNGNLEFEPVPYATVQDALEALHYNEIDCVFPVNFSDYDAEEQGVLTTTTVMESEIHVAVRSNYQKYFNMENSVIVASIRGDLSKETFLLDNFPYWQLALYETEEACFQAVADGEADCVLVTSYRLSRVSDLLEKYKLSTMTTGKPVNFSFAVRRQDDSLYAILNKATNLVRDSAIDSSLASWAYVERAFTVKRFLKDNFLSVILMLVSVLALIIGLLLRSRYSERKAKASLAALQESLAREEKQKKELKTTKKKAYTDPLTGVKSKTAYLEAVDSMEKRNNEGVALQYAIVVFDVNDLKKVNDIQGHEAGDRHIKSACSLICDVFKRSPVYRVGGDEFVAILEGQDYENRSDLMSAFNRMVEENKRKGQVVVSAGFAEYNQEEEEEYSMVFQRADEAMYLRKRMLKP